MKGYKNIVSRNYAVSEVVGGIMLVLIAVVAFSVIYIYLIPGSPEINPSVEIYGEVTNTGKIVLSHKGGSALTNYEIDIRYYENNTPIGSKTINNDNWKINQYRYPLELLELNGFTLIDENCKVNIQVQSINSDGSKTPVFGGVLSGNIKIIPEFEGDLILISTLRTNTTDEDLICFNNTIKPNIIAKTYIYNWLVNDVAFANILMPFDTNNNAIAKDYSGNNMHGTVKDATWISNGVVGGAYYFDGGSDVINISLPDALDDVANNDFTISVWMKSDDITDNFRFLLEGGRFKNFATMFQDDEKLHFGISIDNNQYSVRTEDLSSNTWYHIVGIWDASETYMAIYVNGEKSIEIGERHFPQGVQDSFSLGKGSNSGRFWKGYIDEFQLYDKILSEEQIYQIYLCGKDGNSNRNVIVSKETLTAQTWKCIITPNDGTQDDEVVESNSLQIINYLGGK
jgi:hypothetical protein